FWRIPDIGRALSLPFKESQ
ncbi:3-hydroxydecanoyl-ACP dehydratase domain protein, partial [Vibrio parahaemolyticus EKP-026]